MDINNLFGLPAHPLLMHVPILGIPICAVVALAYLLRPAWRPSLALPFGLFTALTVVFTILVAGSGEQLEKQVEKSALLERHTQLGDQTRLIVIAFGAATLLWLLVDWFGRTNRNHAGRDEASMARETEPTRANHAPHANAIQHVAFAIGLAAVVLGGTATVWDVRTGHSGAKSVWSDVDAGAETSALTPAGNGQP